MGELGDFLQALGIDVDEAQRAASEAGEIGGSPDGLASEEKAACSDDDNFRGFHYSVAG